MQYPNSKNQSYIGLDDKLEQLSGEESECSIYKVHRHLRDLSPEAYEPQLISIGPYHRGKEHLQFMEHHKLRYLKSLLRRNGEENAGRYVAAIKQVESDARKCYAVDVNLTGIEFRDMLVLDGCFIIELVQKYQFPSLIDNKDPIFQMPWIFYRLRRDLMLFENQIPFFVLCQLYDLIEAPNQCSTLTYLFVDFFTSLCPGKLDGDFATNEMKHLLSLIHWSWTQGRNTNPGGGGTKKTLQYMKSASKLREANVEFKKDEKLTLFDIRFDKGVMQMAPLIVDYGTEALLRNLITYEQCFHYDQLTVVTDYVEFMDCLISSSKDIEILLHCGIIDNCVGDEEAVAKMVNKLTDSVTVTTNHYPDISEKVNEHCKNSWNLWMAMLRRNYLNSPWAVLSIIAALILLLLTFTQTLFTVHPL